MSPDDGPDHGNGQQEGEVEGETPSRDTHVIRSEAIAGVGRRTSEIMNFDPDYLFLKRIIKHPGSECTGALEEMLKRDAGIADGTRGIDVTLDDTLGRGGMAAVYLGKIGQETTVAVKVLDATTNANLVDRFNREKEILDVIASDGDQNIVQIYGAGETTLKTCDGYDKRVLYIFFELVKFQDLIEKVNSIPSVDAIPVSYMTGIMKQIAHALKKVHTPTKGKDGRMHNIIHRDVNPNNIFVTDQGIAKLADVGIGKDITGSSAAETTAQFLLGTPAYMSPEQARGEKLEGEAAKKTDVYSWGSSFYFLLTKTRPYEGDSALEIAAKIRVADEPLNVRAINKNVPIQLAEIIEVCTAPDRENRFDSNELDHALELYDKAGSYTREEREAITKSAKAGHLWGKRKKEELENLIRANEQAFWFTTGEDRRAYQENVLNYFDELELKGEGISEDMKLAQGIIRKLRKKSGESVEEEQRIILKGHRFRPFSGKRYAIQVLEHIRDARRLWEKQDYQTAQKLITTARKEYRKVKRRWQRQVKDEIDKFHALLDSSIKAKEAAECFRMCKNYVSQQKVTEADDAFKQGQATLAQIPGILAQYGLKKLKNVQVDYVVNVKKPEAEKALNQEKNLDSINNWIEEMRTYILRDDFKAADAVQHHIQETLRGTEKTDRATQLRHKYLAMKHVKEKAKEFYKAKGILRGAVKDIRERTENSFKSAQRKLDSVEGIISTHLQGREYRGFIEEQFEPLAEELRMKRDDMRLFKKVQKTLKGNEESGERGLKSEFMDNIDPQFLPGNTPDLGTLVRFKSDVSTEMAIFGSIQDPDSIGRDYMHLRSDLEDLKQNFEKKVEDYIEGRFRAAEASVGEIRGEAGEETYVEKRRDAENELNEARRMMLTVLDADALTQQKYEDTPSIQERYDQIDKNIRDAYETADLVRRGRSAIEAELFDEAKSFFERVPENRRADVEKYLEIINLEIKFREEDSNYFWVTEAGLNENIIENIYRQGLETYKNSGGENDFSAVRIIHDIEDRIKFGEEDNPVNEIKELLDTLSKKRAGQAKEKLKEEIYQKLGELIDLAENHLKDHGEKKLKREPSVQLGRAYDAAEFRELGSKYLS
jgi:hypothetical protein